MATLRARLGSLRKPDLPSEHWLHTVSYVPWHIQRAPGGQQAQSACWIHYIHKLIGGLSVFGLAVQHLLPAMFTEAMCQFSVGSLHTSALQHPWCDALCEQCSAEGVICRLFFLLSIFWKSRFVKVISGQCGNISCRGDCFEVMPNWLLMLALEAVLESYISAFIDSSCNFLLSGDRLHYSIFILPLFVRTKEAEYI